MAFVAEESFLSSRVETDEDGDVPAHDYNGQLPGACSVVPSGWMSALPSPKSYSKYSNRTGVFKSSASLRMTGKGGVQAVQKR